MHAFNYVKEIVPGDIWSVVNSFSENPPEEIRLRLGRELSLITDGNEKTLTGFKVNDRHIEYLFEKATSMNMQAVSQTLCGGYISYKGLRIGFCGTTAVTEGGRLLIRDFSSALIRVPKACPQIAERLAVRLFPFENLLIISPPGGGKTTALREIIRLYADSGMRVSVADERNELAAKHGAKCFFDLGRCADVMTGTDNFKAVNILIRVMNPQLIAVDEICDEKTALALITAANSGCGIIASAHAAAPEELRGKGFFKCMLDESVFKRVLVISGSGDTRKYEVFEL